MNVLEELKKLEQIERQIKELRSKVEPDRRAFDGCNAVIYEINNLMQNISK